MKRTFSTTKTATVAVSIFICLFLLLGCKKDGPQQQDDDDDTPTIDQTSSLNRQSGLPGQIFELTTAGGLANEAYTLPIGSETVTASRISSSTLVFILPYIPSGDYYIDLKPINPGFGQLPIKVDSYTPIANVEQTYDEVISWMDEESAVSDDLEVDNLMKQRFEEEFNKLSDADKKAQLFQIKNLLQQIDSEMLAIENSLMASYVPSNEVFGLGRMSGEGLRSAGTRSNVDPNSIRYHAARFTAAMVGGALIVGGAVAVIWGSGPFAVITLPAYAIVAAKALRNMRNIIVDSVVEMWGIAAVAVSDAFSFNSGRGHRSGASFGAKASATTMSGAVGDIVLAKGTPLELDIAFTFGSVALELESLVESAFFGKLFSAYHELIELYTPLYNGQQKLQELLKTDKEILSPPSDFMPADFVTEQRSVTAEEVTIENISPAGLDIGVQQGQNGVVLTANSSTITDSVAMSFDVVYTQEAFGTTLRRTYSGSYDGREDEDEIVGTWIMKTARRWGWSWENNEEGVPEQTPYDDVENYSGLTMTLNGDYTCIIIDEDGGRSEGTYSTNGNKLMLMNTEYDFSLAGNTLITRFRHVDAYGEHNSETTFERQK